MRLVIDSNQMRSPKLRAYLAATKHNFAVLTDYSAIEAYKGGTVEGFWQSMSILSDFPAQVIILKTTGIVCALNGRDSGLQKRLIDQQQTNGFLEFIRDLRVARSGNTVGKQEFLQRSEAARTQMARIFDNIDQFAQGISDTAKKYTKAERSLIRQNKGLTPELIDKSTKDILELAGNLYRRHSRITSVPIQEKQSNSFIFRNALCTYLLALDWCAAGGVQDVSSEHLQNDLIDMNYATYATYFDGLLSDDAKCIRIHKQARIWLRKIFKSRLCK